MNAFGRFSLIVFLLCGSLATPAQTAPPQPPSDEQLQKLADAQQWQEMVQLLEPVSSRSALIDFYLGIALAQTGRVPEAKAALEAGHRLAPSDPRFLVELAGIAFKQKNYPRTTRHLRRALRLAPNDSYTNDFLGTSYFLEGNLEASLKYWNRVGKPVIAAVHSDPALRIGPALLDQAFTFAPAATLTLPQLLDSGARVRGLGIFSQFHFDLVALNDNRFDLSFRAREQNGFGETRLEAFFLLLRGLPFQQVEPQFYNLHGHAINVSSMVRWDAQKRRIFADVSGPFERSAKFRWQWGADLRNENWSIRNGFTGPAPVLASFNMRDERLTFDLASYASERFGWSAGAEISHRNFRAIASGAVLMPQMLASGYELKQRTQWAGTIFRNPDRRFTLSAGAQSEAARLWSQGPQSFEKLTGTLAWHWFPQAQGDDYESSQSLRAGKTFGQTPFDELYILGLERDNDLPLRAHIGTRDGRKGSAPVGRNYLLENWEISKNLYGNGILKVQLGPFFDMGKIADAGTLPGSARWLFDTGAQAKLRVFGSGLIFTYGKDLRTGNNGFYLSLIE